ncbi:uncharacterized, partial [Tachysurus ichikawai]
TVVLSPTNLNNLVVLLKDEQLYKYRVKYGATLHSICSCPQHCELPHTDEDEEEDDTVPPCTQSAPVLNTVSFLMLMKMKRRMIRCHPALLLNLLLSSTL